MWAASFAMLIGLVVLVWSADKFIDGAKDLAIKFNMPNFLIGALILGIGTSAPEMMVSTLSAMAGSPGLALGNAYGSNIINIALILGLTTLVTPLLIRASVLRFDFVLLMMATLLAAWQLFDGTLTRFEGVILLLALTVVIGLQIFVGLRHRDTADESNEQARKAVQTGRALATLIFGLVLLILSSRAIVWGAVELATFWGLSELVIGLTIVAIGTSLPELVASLVSARRGEHDMALGNIIGSNIFNTLGVVGVAAIIAPMQVESIIVSRDVLVMAGVTALLFVLCLFSLKFRRGALDRISGSVLLLVFVGYTLWLLQTAAA